MTNAVSPFAPRCWHLSNPGGVGGFSFGLSSSSAINCGTGSVYRDKGEEEDKEDASYALAAAFSVGLLTATTPAVIASAGEKTAASRFSFRYVPS